MLKIDRLRLRLPAGYEGRADGIARRLARELAARPWPTEVDLEALDAGTVEVGSGLTDADLAGSIAGSIRRATSAATGRGGRR